MKKVVLQMVLIIVLQKSELIHIILSYSFILIHIPIEKKLTFHDIIILIKSVVTKNNTRYF